MKVVFWALVLLSSQTLFATSYTSIRSGDFNDPMTWGGRGYPHAGDSWTISSHTSVTCSGVCESGLAIPVVCTVDGTVNAGGTLTVAPGATLTHSGGINVQHSGTLNVWANATSGSGTLVVAPGSLATCSLGFTNISQGAPSLNLIGAAGSPGNNHYAVLACDTPLHGGAACIATPEPGGTNANLNFNYFKVTGFGSASQLAFKTFAVNSVSIQNGLFDNNGTVRLLTGSCSSCSFVVQNVSFTNPRDVVSHFLVFDFYGSTLPTGGAVRSIQNVTAANLSQTVHYFANISIPQSQIGQSVLAGDPVNNNGFIGYNVSLLQTSSNAASQIVRSSGVILDVGGSASYCYELRFNSGLNFQDSFCLDRVPNQHEIVSVVGGTTTGNLYQRYLCDGDGFYNSDTGDMIQDWGAYTMRNSIGVNFCGTMTTISQSGGETASVLENTNYNNFGETYCEAACRDGIHPVFRDNLIVKPADVNSRGLRGDDGEHAATVFQRQSNFSLDYNGFYQMPGSGDPGAELQPAGVPALLPNPSLGGITSYVNVSGAIVGGLTNRTITTVSDPMHISCTSCNFTQPGAAGVMPGDFFEDFTLRKVATVASVTDSTHLVLTGPGISGMTQGRDTLTITTSYWNHPGWYYGDSNNGSHDIHADPMFVDSSRTLCSWYSLKSGVPLSCPTYGSIMNGNATLVSTSGTGGMTIVCSSCNFLANGISTADVVRVFAGTGQTVRGASSITAVSPTTLTLDNAIPGLRVGDAFDFITVTQGLGSVLVQAAGFDWNGNPVAAPSWASVPAAMQYIYAGFAPRNLIYQGAGSPADGFPDIGAVPVQTGHFDLNP